ncbi:MAG TPA: hypothetical protein VMS31_17180 [Pyrinomonadaceae bacterium]|nr:hypothetical protein [Pyrinomonadaceae bacterium]
MAVFDDDNGDLFSQWRYGQTMMVNCFRIADPDTYSDQYLYIPGNSFHRPGDHALENVDIDPKSYPYRSINIAAETYVPIGPAFMVWPADQHRLKMKDGIIDLSEFRSVRHVPGEDSPFLGRRLRLASDLPAPPTADRPDPKFTGQSNLPVTINDLHFEPGANDLPGFSAPAGYLDVPGASQVYEHSAKIIWGPGEKEKFLYDFQPAAHDGWGEGVPVFWAVPPERVAKSLEDLAREAQETRPKPADVDELTSADNVYRISHLAASMALSPGMSLGGDELSPFVTFLKSLGYPVKLITSGMSLDAAVIVGGMMETGTVYDLERRALHDYSTWGFGVSPAVGGTVNLTLGYWWGESEEEVLKTMQGLSSYLVFGGTFGMGVNFYITMTLEGKVYGLTISPQFGPEVEVAIGYGGTYTWLYGPSPQRGGPRITTAKI